jgi:kynurenine formamidase
MSLAIEKIIDISLELDPKNFGMRTPAGFKKDMQFEMETLKEHDAPGGAGQIVRGVHMRLHAGSHVDAPEHNVRGGTQIHQLPLDLFIGDAIVADLRDKIRARRSPRTISSGPQASVSGGETAFCCAPITTTPMTAARTNG